MPGFIERGSKNLLPIPLKYRDSSESWDNVILEGDVPLQVKSWDNVILEGDVPLQVPFTQYFLFNASLSWKFLNVSRGQSSQLSDEA